MAKRTIQLAPRTLIGPVTDFLIPQTVAIQPGETEWVARLDPDKDYPTCAWDIRLEYSLDNEVTWNPWRESGDTSMVLTDKGVYQSIGGTFPDVGGVVLTPTHIRGFISLSERIRCGLIAVAV